MYKELLTRLANALGSESVEYALIGGQAVLIHGEPRLTRDIDITLALTVDEVQRMDKVLELAKLKSIAPDDRFTVETFVLPCIDEGSKIRIDFIFSMSDFEREAIARSKSIEINGIPVKFVTAEDLIVHKLVAGRPRDVEDAKTVIEKASALDTEYIRRWLEQFREVVDHDPVTVFNNLLV